MNDGSPIADVVGRMQQRLDELPEEVAHRRYFLSTYLRTTQAVGKAIDDARFEDPDWVELWDVKFAELYLQAHDADLAPRPWRLAFEASPELPALGHVLLGINAHVNYDLPQALLEVISDEDFLDPALMNQRRRDHERIDGVLSARVAAEDEELAATGVRSLLDRVLTPLNRLSSQRFLRESRQKVWHNTTELQRARVAGSYEKRLAELEVLSAAKVADLLRPGQVLLRLAVTGFGVTLPPL
ncbi:DUF5995 family protein [Kribbella pratensis]|jgi:hypothetical protein|uniref:Uncharacterized protein n=1 Tax=Kribbella pratensis TaxID=2512112 RepID=A0A4R8CI25_9ACTN|nr:DUF5995 family protein [Kribbella pratensis]TDW75415.1 hypothetical protein EV653_0546 [Kribbella pratensis]